MNKVSLPCHLCGKIQENICESCFPLLIKQIWLIIDWAGNVCFHGKEFHSFEDAEEFLSEVLSDNYDENRGEYYAVIIAQYFT